MSRPTEITTSRRGDVTNARYKQTVLCPLLISNYWTGGCCELKCAWFYCLLRSYKSTLQLCGLSEHVDVAFITNQKWVWLLSDCYVLWKVLVYWGTARGLPRVLWVLYTMFPVYARIFATLKFREFTCQRNWGGGGEVGGVKYQNGILNRDNRRLGCGIVVKRERDCGIRT